MARLQLLFGILETISMYLPTYLIHYTKLSSRLVSSLSSLKHLGLYPNVVSLWDAEDIPLGSYAYDYSLWEYRVGAIKHCLLANAIGGYHKLNTHELYKASSYAQSTMAWMMPRELTKGEISVLLKHYYALTCAATNSHQYTLICEDDILLSDNSPDLFGKSMQTFISLRGDYLDLAGGSGLKPSHLVVERQYLNISQIKPASTRCNAAYVVSKDLACFIVKRFLPLVLPIDWHLQYLLTLYSPLKCFWSCPEALIHGSETPLIQSWRDS